MNSNWLHWGVDQFLHTVMEVDGNNDVATVHVV